MDTRIIVLLATLAAGAAQPNEGVDSATLPDTAEARATTDPDSHRSTATPTMAPDSAPTPASATASIAEPPVPGAVQAAQDEDGNPAGGNWTLLVDLADVDGGKRLNQRHMRTDSITNLCCLDFAWTPLRPAPRLAVGVSANLGRLSQELSDGTIVEISDILVASSVLYRREGSGLWARVDLGISTLVVDRITVGVDWGVGGAVRAGWRWERPPVAWIAGLGWDFRHYAHLDMKDVPAITLSAGVEW